MERLDRGPVYPMRFLVATALLLVTAILPTAAAAPDCGLAPFVPVSIAPLVSQTGDVRVEGSFLDPDTACGLVAAHVEFDGQPIPGHLVTKATNGNVYTFSFEPETTLAPGWHSVDVMLYEACCRTASTSSNSWRYEWSFRVLPSLDQGAGPGLDETIPRTGTNVSLPSEIRLGGPVCDLTTTVCAGPFPPIPLPARLRAGLFLDDTGIQAWSDPTATTRYGPYREEVPTPYGPIPVIVCASTCILPDPQASASVSTSLTIHIAAGPVNETRSVPIEV